MVRKFERKHAVLSTTENFHAKILQENMRGNILLKKIQKVFTTDVYSFRSKCGEVRVLAKVVNQF